MFVLNSDITIGTFKKVKVTDCKISKSLFTYVDKATFKVPATSRLIRAGEVITVSADTSKLIVEGLPVTIRLGYNGSLQTEFVGFVSRVNLSAPCEIECEGYSYQLRKRTYKRVFKDTTVKDILSYLIAGTDIVLSPSIPEAKVSKFVIDDKNGTEALEQLIKEIKGISVYFTGKELFAGLRFLTEKPTTKYRLGWNVIKDNNLKLREAKNQQVTIKIKGEKQDGSKVTAEFGDSGEIKQISTHAVTDPGTLKSMAEAEHKKISYSGYEGKITAFLSPYCEPGYLADIIDKKYPQREGKYIVNAVEVTYGMGGARRIVDIGFKV